MKSRKIINTGNILYKLGQIKALSSRVMSFIENKDYPNILMTCSALSIPLSIPIRYRYIYPAHVNASNLDMLIRYKNMRVEFSKARDDLVFAVSFAQYSYVNESQAIRHNYNPGTNLFSLFSLVPACYHIVKSSYEISILAVQGSLHIIGFCVGGARDVTRFFTTNSLEPVILPRPSDARNLRSESSGEFKDFEDKDKVFPRP